METEIGGKEQPFKQFKGTIEYEINFTEKGIEFIYSPQSDEINLLALFIAEECALRAKENISAYLKKNANDPNRKKMEDRLSWAGKTVKGLQIQQDAFIDIIRNGHEAMESIKAIQAQNATDLIKKIEAKIESGEIKEVEVKVTKQNEIKDI